MYELQFQYFENTEYTWVEVLDSNPILCEAGQADE